MEHSELDYSDRTSINHALNDSSEIKQLGILTLGLCKRPNDAFLHGHIGRVYYGLGELASAATHLDIAISAKIENPFVYFHRALVYRHQNDLPKCAALLEHTVTLTDNVDYWLTLIAVLMQLHKFEDAIVQSNHALQAYPSDGRFAHCKATALMANNQFDVALKWCNEQDIEGTNPEWSLLRYQIYSDLNNDAQAAIEYQEHTHRKILSQNDYRDRASEVLASITDVTLRKQFIQAWQSKLDKLSNTSAVSSAKTSLPKVAMSILVRDEVDIIAENIRYHAAHGVAHFIVTDNGSVDGTREVLAELQSAYSLEIIDEPSHTIDQDLWVTRMAEQLKVTSDCDWVIHNDADEFWVPNTGSIPVAIQAAIETQADVGVLACKRLNMLPDKQQLASPEFIFHDSYFAAIKTVPLIDGEQPWSDSDSNCVARMVMDKVLTRMEGLGDIEYGNHGATHTMPASGCSTITILHFPVRTFKQFERKVKNYGESLEKNDRFSSNSSGHLRYWYKRYNEGKLHEDYESITFDQDRLQTLLADGFVKKDTRVQSYFKSESAELMARSA